MTLRWCRDGDYWYDLESGRIEGTDKVHEARHAQRVSGVAIIRDLPAYKSPVDGRVIDGRTARREDMARSGCREVDPTEHKVQYTNKRFANKNGVEYAGS